MTTYYVGQHYEKKGTTVTKYYFAGATRLAVRTNGTLSYLLGDHLGSSSVTTNASGVKTASALYKAFGETRYSSGALGTDYKFTGQREQAELGLYFYGARWYDGSLGRFTSADTMIPSTQGTQAWDRYVYANNNPVRYNDPTGHNTECGLGESCYGSGPNPNDPPSGGGGGGVGGGSGDKIKNNNHHNCLEDLGDCYMQGWDNFGSAWSIYWNPNATIDQRIVSGLYMGVWITVHVVFVAGVAMLAYGLIVPTGGACAMNPACEEKGLAVLGRWPANKEVAKLVGGKYLNIPMETWDKLDEAGRWALNQQWLDDAISRGDTFIMASKWADVGTSYFHQEMQYLFSQGYTLSLYQNYLIPPP